jgi:hypothetical protein
MRRWNFFLFLILLAVSDLGRAEYRVFNLRITNTQTQAVREVLSTLDPLQYRHYYPVENDEVLSYVETWRCFGRTGDFQPYCPNPKAQTPPPPANP